MKIFTYLDYIKSIHMFKLNNVLKFEEDTVEYRLQEKEETKEDVVISILENKKEMAEFINQFLNLKDEISEEELIKVKNDVITNKGNGKKNNIIYKQKDKEIFFLIEHQITITEELTYNMLNFCMEILQEWGRNKRAKISAKKPIVIPIVIYTGNEKIKRPEPISYNKIGNYSFENFEMNFEYNLINIRNTSPKYLIEKGTIFAYSMILEKSKNESELKQNKEMLKNTIQDAEKLKEIQKIYKEFFYSFQ